MWRFIRGVSLYSAWLLSCVALLMTLYASEIQHLPVCTLCWYQRIALYPLVILLGIAAYTADRAVKKYALPLCVLQLLIAVWHIAEQINPVGMPFSVCHMGASCAQQHIVWFNWVTWPMLSAFSALCITIGVAIYRPMDIEYSNKK